MVVTIFPSPGENWPYMKVTILALIPEGIFRLFAVALMGVMGLHCAPAWWALMGMDGARA